MYCLLNLDKHSFIFVYLIRIKVIFKLPQSYYVCDRLPITQYGSNDLKVSSDMCFFLLVFIF